ncbi:hypothetical protein HYT00_01120 [Candidatus Giovannonibacteria bacterium]|nr:hypothetical protein [Candidatus Giovannonibacteria bacterium]
MKLNSKILFLLSVVLCLSMFFFGWFLFNKIAYLDKSIAETNDKIFNFRAELINLKSWERFLDETGNERKILSSAFVNEKSLVHFIEDLEKSGRENGVEVEVHAVNLAEGQNEPPSFRLESAGNFSSVYKYLISLETLPYEIVFRRVFWDAESEGKWRGVYEINLVSYEY